MKRTYGDTISTSAACFVGNEVEKTPMYGEPTLFVTGLQPIEDIQTWIDIHGMQHIFFGANHSFNPALSFEWNEWDTMITHFLDAGYWCSLDIPMNVITEFHDTGLCSNNKFIPQIRVPLPYIELWNYNTMIKLDDIGYDQTNPGVWCHALHDLKDRDKFTSWDKYTNDTLIKDNNNG
jgi:hypothetical protein